MLTTFFLKDCLCQIVQSLFKGKSIVLISVYCVVLQPTKTIIFTSLSRTILWGHAGLGILFLNLDVHYFWIMVVLVHCAVQWKLFFIELNCSQTVASPEPQLCAGLSSGLFRKRLGNAMRRDRAVMQELCLVQTCAEWTIWRNAALSSLCVSLLVPTEHRVTAEGVSAQRPRGGSDGRRRSVPLGQPRAAPLCPQHPRALTCCCKCVTVALLCSCPKWHPTKVL